MTSAHPIESPAKVGAAVRGEFPIFETATYLNSCSQGALSHRVREAVEGWLAGWDANGAEWEFWVERNGRSARASPRCSTRERTTSR